MNNSQLFIAVTLWCMMNIDLCRDHMNDISDEAMQATNEHTIPFMLDLFKEIAPSTDVSNVLISPISVVTLLGMISAGAQGETDLEITKVLGWNDMNEIAAHSGMSRTIKTINSYSDIKNATVFLGNSIFVQDGYKVLKKYQRAVSEHYGVDQMSLVDFGKPGTRDLINKYVANMTNNLITESIPPNILDGTTRLVMCNALFFRAAWKKPFSEYFTFNRTFKQSNNKNIITEMMSITDKFNYAFIPDIGAKVVELEYLSLNVSMYILLPQLENSSEDPMEALKKMKANIDRNQHFFKEVDSKLKERKVSLTLPKFSMTADYDLKKYLPILGINRVLDPHRADLSGITGRRFGLHVSSVLMKASIKVDEKGSIGAAAASGAFGTRSSRLVVVAANRPFAFYIYDKTTKAVLFFGQLVDPTKSV
ncbi:Leukocyte elastase inhibitor [Nymphon striatum]|nr:Leukocyte elastase inhibitor [Nymphon striatum]KAG1662455.1 Leukocyte elastase inhibitor [Nymphon striatum]